MLDNLYNHFIPTKEIPGGGKTHNLRGFIEIWLPHHAPLSYSYEFFACCSRINCSVLLPFHPSLPRVTESMFSAYCCTMWKIQSYSVSLLRYGFFFFCCVWNIDFLSRRSQWMTLFNIIKWITKCMLQLVKLAFNCFIQGDFFGSKS